MRSRLRPQTPPSCIAAGYGRVGHTYTTGTYVGKRSPDLPAQMLCVLSFSSIIFRYPRAVSVYPIARTRTMSNLAAGKKAAAVKAVDDYVKVGEGGGRPFMFLVMISCNLDDRRPIKSWEWGAAAPLFLQWNDLASGSMCCGPGHSHSDFLFDEDCYINLIKLFVPQLKELNKRNLRWYVFLHHSRLVSSSLTTSSLWVTWRHIQR